MLKNSFRSVPLTAAAALLTIAVAAQLATALTFDAISSSAPFSPPVGHVAGDEMTNYDLRSGTEVLFRTEYHREFWDGDLVAYQVNAEGDVSTATQPWVASGGGNAGFQLDTRIAPRVIVTRKSDGTPIPFSWSALDDTQKAQIDPSTSTSATSSNVLDYLRGVRTGEVQQGGTLRQRASPLGDILHSRPFYVSDSISPTVFVGANDGMLHAFNALTGAERWAYVPSMLIPKMRNLSINPATGSAYPHDYYVDGSVMVASISSGTKRVLVGGLGAGGKGLFGLDITGSARLAPADETAAKTNILWEVTNASSGYANLGYTFAKPLVTKVKDGSATKDVVIVGNGYNNNGDGKAYLYIINALDGSLLYALAAGASGSVASPNGLSSPVAVDDNADGIADFVYAGDLAGSLWKFSLGPLASSSAATVTNLLTTSPAQPITSTPGVARHPGGGYMLNFATGAMLRAADATDTSAHYAYGIWDGAPVENDTLLTQTITERCYTTGAAAAATPCASRVRTVTANIPDWTSGTGHHKGWKVLLPGSSSNPNGEKVVGDGSFIENARFYFTAHNPNVSTTVQASTVKGENWLMELDYLSGGVKNSPFLDLSDDQLLTNEDRVKDSATPRAPELSTNGIPVGKMISIGVMSQPILVRLSTLNNTLFNQNPDVPIVPVVLGTGAGVTGGHFDVDFFHTTPTGGAQASFTIKVGNNGQTAGIRATLGGITVDGVVIVPALTVNDIANGTAISTNATLIKNKVTNGFTATLSGDTITVKAPVGTQYNGKSVVVVAGTSQTPLQAYVPALAAVSAVAGSAPTNGSFRVDDIDNNKTISLRCGSTYFGVNGTWSTPDSSNKSTQLNDFFNKVNGKLVNGYTTTCTKVMDGSSTDNLNCTVASPVGVSACSNGFDFDNDIDTSDEVDPRGGVNAVAAVVASPEVAASGWTNFAPALTITSFNNSGVDSTTPGDTCTSGCTYDRHIHQYDDAYDVTGVNMLNPSDASVHINLGLSSLTTNFKVLLHNQYLSPALKLHIGNPAYRFDVDFGYISVKDYQTSANLSLANYQTYRRDPNIVWTAADPLNPTVAEMARPKPIGSLAFNMPLDALDVKDWWGNGDVRVGLMPMTPWCMWEAAGSNDGNMYMPVIPPVSVTANGPGTKGWSNSTTPATASGARHGGALMVQLVRDTTPDSAIEENVRGRPEFGWRVRSALYSNYVIAEWGTYWHHPNGKCFYDTGWTKTPPKDNGSSSQKTKAFGSTDPHLGDLSAGGGSGSATITSSVTTVAGDVTTTTITYADSSFARIVRTVNGDGTVTIVTRDALGVTTTQNIANTSGSLKGGGDERGLQAGTGRVSWREVIAP